MVSGGIGEGKGHLSHSCALRPEPPAPHSLGVWDWELPSLRPSVFSSSALFHHRGPGAWKLPCLSARLNCSVSRDHSFSTEQKTGLSTLSSDPWGCAAQGHLLEPEETPGLTRLSRGASLHPLLCLPTDSSSCVCGTDSEAAICEGDQWPWPGPQRGWSLSSVGASVSHKVTAGAPHGFSLNTLFPRSADEMPVSYCMDLELVWVIFFTFNVGTFCIKQYLSPAVLKIFLHKYKKRPKQIMKQLY